MNVNINEKGVKITGGLNVEVTDDTATFDEGRLVVARKDGGFAVRAEGFANIETNTDSVSLPETVQYDPHWYQNGKNHLTVNDSVDRVVGRIDEMLFDHNEDEPTPREWAVIEETAKAIIVDEDTEGRHSVYKVAGGVLKGMSNGDYEGVPFAWLFKGVVEGYIHPPIDTPKNPFSGFVNNMYPTYFGRGA